MNVKKRELLLNKIKFLWESINESQWNEKFNELKNFLKKIQNLNLNTTPKCISGYVDKENC